jgi:hypothetical protein
MVAAAVDAVVELKVNPVGIAAEVPSRTML